MSLLSGLPRRQPIRPFGRHDLVERHVLAGQEVIVRKKDGGIEIQKLDRHNQPTGDSLKL